MCHTSRYGAIPRFNLSLVHFIIPRFQIYNEEIYDLLSPPSSAAHASGNTGVPPSPQSTHQFRIRERRSSVGDPITVFIPGLTRRRVPSKAAVFEWIGEGMSYRHISGTALNRESSRGHTILSLTLESRSNPNPAPASTDSAAASIPAAAAMDTVQYRSVLNLVDLAGSERMNVLSSNDGISVPPTPTSSGGGASSKREGTYINKSLYFLTTVITRLANINPNPNATSNDGNGNGNGNGAPISSAASTASTMTMASASSSASASPFVPYRNSKLTRILQPSLGGNARTVIICCITPAERHFTETVSTLKFAAMAQNVKNIISTNVIPNTKPSANANAEPSQTTQPSAAAAAVGTHTSGNGSGVMAVVPGPAVAVVGSDEIVTGLQLSEALLSDWSNDATLWERCDSALERAMELEFGDKPMQEKAFNLFHELMTTIHRCEERDGDKQQILSQITTYARQLAHDLHLSQRTAQQQMLEHNLSYNARIAALQQQIAMLQSNQIQPLPALTGSAPQSQSQSQSQSQLQSHSDPDSDREGLLTRLKASITERESLTEALAASKGDQKRIAEHLLKARDENRTPIHQTQ